MSIVFFDVEDWERERIPQTLGGEAVSMVADRLTKETVEHAAAARVLSVFTWSKVTADMLARMPELEFIATRSTGFDHIDLEACRERGVMVSNVPHYGERTVAEHTIALMLALSRKLVQAQERGKAGNFSRDGLRGFDLDGKTLGLVGCGLIGRKVAEIARAFAMRVVAFDPKPDASLTEELRVEYVDTVEAVLGQADVVSLHAPLNDATHHIINLESIEAFKRGAILINTARGDLVQTAAVLKALDEGVLSGVGLDVVEHEGLIGEEAEILSKSTPSDMELAALLRNNILFSNPKVIVTPHNAFNSEEAVAKILDTSISNIEAFLTQACLNLVSR